MTTFADFAQALSHWLRENNVESRSLTVTLAFGDIHEAAHFCAALRKELSEVMNYTDDSVPNNLEIVGTKIKIELPF